MTHFYKKIKPIDAEELWRSRMKIKSIKKFPPQFTVDIETQNTHTYQLGNKVVSHNTTSLVLGTSSGVHAWHNDYYVRRLRVDKNEAIYQYLAETIPDMLEDEFFRPNQQAVISIPVKAPDGAVTRQESALDLLNRVSKVWKEWVKPGHRKGANKNNVSTTVNVRDNEWEIVRDWMWENRENFTALSCFPTDNNNYVQPPFQDITKEEYEEMSKHLHKINLNKVVEVEDKTTLNEEVACGGGGCEVR